MLEPAALIIFEGGAFLILAHARAHRRPIRRGTASRSRYTRVSLSITCLSCVSVCAPRESVAADSPLRAAGPPGRLSGQRGRPAGHPHYTKDGGVAPD